VRPRKGTSADVAVASSSAKTSGMPVTRVQNFQPPILVSLSLPNFNCVTHP